MAKLTKKIRIAEYDVLANLFKITFQLSGDNEFFHLEVTYDQRRDIHPTSYTSDTFDMLGFSSVKIEDILGEIFDWMEWPRKRLGGLSYGYTMRSRLDLAENAGKERRRKAAVERIQVEAPCLDWAMSVTEEFVDRLKLPVEAIKAVEDRIAAMEATGIGEKTPEVETPEGWEVAPADNRPSMFVDALNAVLPRLVDEVGANLGHLFELQPLDFDKRNLIDAFRQSFQDAFKIATVDRPQRERNTDEARYLYRRKIAEERTEKAVNSIHTQARRFTKPMSLREHDFLRAVVQEEIEKVLEGVL